MKKIKIFPFLAMIAMLATSMVFTACEEDDDPIPVEALITSFAVTNAGGEGDLRVEGDISDFNILVTVPFETDVTTLVTDIELSEGASVVPASGEEVDFSDPRNFVVSNEDESNTYQVTVELAEPTEPSITDITLISEVTGLEYQTEISQADKSIQVTFNELQSRIALIDNIEIAPAGTTYSTYSGSDTLNLDDDNISITVSFAGEESVYTVEPIITEAGFNPDNTIMLMDKSGASGSVPSVISNENNRGAAFDGKHVFVASRQDGNQVYYWDVDAPNDDPNTLEFGDVVEGGAWVISDVVVNDGNIYVSNMVNAAESIFKVYKWESVDDTEPELVLEYTIPDFEEGEDIRLGDAISIIGNPPLDGYIFASNFAWPNDASEFYKFSFNGDKNVEPTLVPIVTQEALRMGQYGRVNVIPGHDDLLLVTGAEMAIAIIDYSGDIKFEATESIMQSRSFSPYIFEYNDGLYLSYSVNREWEANGIWYDVINISEGADIIAAFEGLNSENIADKRVFRHLFSGPVGQWVGADHAVAFSDDGKPRIMGFGLMNGFVVHEFSN